MTFRRIIITLCLLFSLARPHRAAAVTVPPDFVVENIAPTSTFSLPTALAWLPDGRLLVAEKRGKVYTVLNGVKSASPLWDGETEVLSNGDRGLLGLAVDPGYAANRFIYLLYTVDPDSDGVDNNDDAFGRLTRYQVSAADSTIVDPASRTMLMGTAWAEGPPSGSSSHTIGGLRWGADGSLLVSIGDGAQYSTADAGGLDPGLFSAGRTNPFEDIGAFRARYVGSLAGKILRIDPATGLGYPGNPFFDGDAASARSKVWLYGLRNPFRFCVEPGTGDPDPARNDPGVLHIGDVGWNAYEEYDVASGGGLNFGWPCTEGPAVQPDYQAAAPAHGGCDSTGTGGNPAAETSPVSWWHHYDGTLSFPLGLNGNSALGGVFYTGTRYPNQYRDRLFMADFGRGWIKTFVTDSSYNLLQVGSFADSMEGPVDLITEPGSGDLVYISIYRSEVKRIRYTGSVVNHAPVASAEATPVVGLAPLTVDFTSAGTYDEDLDPLSLSWLFGDGTGSTEASPQHTYEAGVWRAVLTADDGQGGIGRDTVLIIVPATTAFPTTPVLDDFNRPDGPVGGNWAGTTSGLSVDQNRLIQTAADSWAIWSPEVFDPTQEVFYTLSEAPVLASHIDLVLKAQGTYAVLGYIQVRYDAVQNEISVSAYTPGGAGWQMFDSTFPETLAVGDQWGARAYENGVVEIYINGALFKSVDASSRYYSGMGGRIGLQLSGAAGDRFDDFGGGSSVLDPNTPPAATVLSPADSSFYAEGDTVYVSGAATDAEDPPDSLDYHWVVDLHHEDHVHPGVFESDLQNTFFIGVSDDDGSGVSLEVRLEVTDTGGLVDSARVFIYPSPVSGVERASPAVDAVLSWPRPNPTSGAAEMTLRWPRESQGTLHVFDISGRRVWSGKQSLRAGENVIRWDGRVAGSRAADGIYYLVLRVDGQAFRRRFVLVRE